jgi:hypothetical protein
MKKYEKHIWTDAENGLLRDYYYMLSREELFKTLPSRDLSQIIKQVVHLTKKGWKFSEPSR